MLRSESRKSEPSPGLWSTTEAPASRTETARTKQLSNQRRLDGLQARAIVEREKPDEAGLCWGTARDELLFLIMLAQQAASFHSQDVSPLHLR